VSLVELTDGRGGEGEKGREGAKSYDSEKAWSSINHSILSGSNAFLEHGLCKDVFECRCFFVFSFGDSNSLREILDEQFSNSFAFEKIKKRRSDN
jgi:hypothetical protein